MIFQTPELKVFSSRVARFLTLTSNPPSDGADPRTAAESIAATGHSRARFDLDRLVPQTVFDGTTTVPANSAPPESATHHSDVALHVHIAIEGTLR